MKIAIDARLYGSGGGGIGRYSENLVKNLESVDKKNKYSIILKKDNFFHYEPNNPNFEKILADARSYSVKEQLLLPAVLAKLKPDLVHFTHFNVPLLYPGRFVVTIHDIIKGGYKGSSSTTRVLPVYYLKRVGYELSIRQAVNRSNKIFVPSKAVKRQISESLGLSTSKILVTYESVDPSFHSEKSIPTLEGVVKKTLATYGIHKPFLLYVGTTYPHKNLENLFQSLNLITKGIRLVIISKKDIFTERLLKKAKKAGVEDCLVVTGFVPNEDLAVLYKHAEMLVFPSFSEGFGLPGIEAMATGCPVVASDIPVFKEVYGDAALYFDPKDPKDMSEKIKLLLANRKSRIAMIKKGFEQVKKYSWRKMAQQTLKVYQEFA